MTIRITKLRLGALLAALALLIPSTAWATHVFTDVVDGAFYAAPAEWAKTNNITTGSPAGSSTFKPLDPVTRGESVTFLKRYHDNLVQPEIDTNTAGIATNTAGIATNTAGAAANTAAIGALPTLMWARVSSTGTVEASSGSVTVAKAGTGLYDVTFPQNVGNCAIQTSLYVRSNLIGNILFGLAYLLEGYTFANDSDASNDGTVRAFTVTHDTGNTNGNTAATYMDLPFTITATC